LTALVADRLGQGSAVVLLHGQPGSRADWRRVVPLLEQDHTVVVPDRPGYGATGGAAVGFADNAAAAVRLLDDLGVQSAVFVGYSWSGGVALSAALHHRARVDALVLVASVRPGEEVGWADRIMAAPLAGEIAGALTLGTTSRVLRMKRVQDLVDRRLPRSARDAVRALAGASNALTGARVWRSFAAEQRFLLNDLPGLAAGIPTIEAPTIVLNGGSDHVVPAAVGARLAAAIPGAEFRVVPRAHHLLPFDHPEEIASAVRAVSRRV
jgi:pimeloyl-ACP methyl ester carboxylesterase